MGALALLDASSVAESPPLAYLADLAVLSLGSPSSRRNYAREIRRYLATGLALSREGVQTYMQQLRRARAGPVTLNVALAAIRLLAREANARGIVSDVALGALERIRGQKRSGDRLGRWLELPEVEMLLDRATGTRNKALIACMVGCGLRRAEVCALDWAQWQQRGGRWLWCNLMGKGGKIRSVPVPSWAAEHINTWKAEYDVRENEVKTGGK